jgi:putative FmdB family regulatory protein
MPIYVYECKQCDTKVERPQKYKQKKPNPLCHICGKKMKWVKYPGCDFELKGGGWTK